jgi:Aldos-2-ulose dehydratase, beta-propeller domain/FG-GAP-like repeat
MSPHGRALIISLLVFALAASARGQSQFNFREQEIEKGLGVGYAVSLVDVNGDKKLDIVVVDTNRVLWYENPTWKRRTIIEDQTKKDNVCIAPYDIDGDGQVDFALGADWRPADTVNSGTIQWLKRGKSLDEKWTVYPIGTEPTVHRMRWADFDGDGRAELIVAPLQGRGTRGPNFEGAGVHILRYKIPDDPTKQENWKAEVINDELHASHNLWPTDLNRDGKLDLLVGSFEGVSLLERSSEGNWKRTVIGSGNQETRPNRGSSEIKIGRLGDKSDYLATIEPWHGFQVVVYTTPQNSAAPLWQRKVLDDELAWGHAVWCANLDDDPEEELIIGVRDNKDAQHRSGVRIFDPQASSSGAARRRTDTPPVVNWQRTLIDPGGVAVEDLAAADLDGDGDIDIVAAGRATKNVKIYWNERAK